MDIKKTSLIQRIFGPNPILDKQKLDSKAKIDEGIDEVKLSSGAVDKIKKDNRIKDLILNLPEDPLRIEKIQKIKEKLYQDAEYWNTLDYDKMAKKMIDFPFQL